MYSQIVLCAAAAKSLQSCPTLCDPIDGSPPGSPVSGILQARTLEWVAISFSSAWKWKVKGKSLSRVRLFTIEWTAAYQAPPSMGFSRQEYGSRGRSQDGGGIGWGDHFLSYKFIKRMIERWTNFTKHLLIASRGHQTPRQATHCLWREVGQNIKDKKGDKRARDGDPSREGSLNRGSFQTPGNPCTGRSEGSFQISEGNLTGRKN